MEHKVMDIEFWVNFGECDPVDHKTIRKIIKKNRLLKKDCHFIFTFKGWDIPVIPTKRQEVEVDQFLPKKHPLKKLFSYMQFSVEGVWFKRKKNGKIKIEVTVKPN